MRATDEYPANYAANYASHPTQAGRCAAGPTPQASAWDGHFHLAQGTIAYSRRRLRFRIGAAFAVPDFQAFPGPIRT